MAGRAAGHHRRVLGARTRKQEITPQQIRTNPSQVLREIEEAYATRMGVPAKAA